MLPRRQRLGREGFETVFREGRGLSSPHVSLKTKATPGESLVAVAVSGKGVKGAVARNRLRRQGYAALRSLSLPHDVSMVVMIRKAAPMSTLTEELHSLLESLRRQHS